MPVVVVIGPDEAANGQVTIKDLCSGTQQTLLRSKGPAVIKDVLDSHRPM